MFLVDWDLDTFRCADSQHKVSLVFVLVFDIDQIAVFQTALANSVSLPYRAGTLSQLRPHYEGADWSVLISSLGLPTPFRTSLIHFEEVQRLSNTGWQNLHSENHTT